MAPSEELAAKLQSIANEASSGRQNSLRDAVNSWKEEDYTGKNPDDAVALLNAIYEQPLGVVATRALVDAFISALETVNPELWFPNAEQLKTLVDTNSSPSSEAALAIRTRLAELHEADEDFQAAAKVLSEIPLETSQRTFTEQEKADIWIRVARNHLEVDDTVAADMYINKLKNVMHLVRNEETRLHFNLSLARVLDSKRDFLGAAHRYHDISFSRNVAEEERLHTLAMAIKCAILAPAGPHRSRTLGRLHKDDRASQLPEFAILEKIFLDRLLRKDEVDKFAEGLQPHQLATTSDGSTVLAKAIMEHNVLGVSRLFNNITFDVLAKILGLDADKAESTVARMIEQGRLLGRIDQLAGTVYFEGGEASGEKGSGKTDVKVGHQMRRWDANIESLAQEVENITNVLHQRFPVCPLFQTRLVGSLLTKCLGTCRS